MGLLQGLAEIVLNVRDQQVALQFYRDLLGLKVLSPLDRPGPIFLQAGPEQAGIPQLIVLVPLPADSPTFTKPRTLHHLAFAVNPTDFDQLAEQLQAAGLPTRGGQHPILPSRTLYTDDPDGNEVEFICQA